MFYPNTVWNSGNLVLDSAAQKTRCGKVMVSKVWILLSFVLEKESLHKKNAIVSFVEMNTAIAGQFGPEGRWRETTW